MNKAGAAKNSAPKTRKSVTLPARRERPPRPGRISFRAEHILTLQGNRYCTEQGEVSLAALCRKSFIQFLRREGYLKENEP